MQRGYVAPAARRADPSLRAAEQRVRDITRPTQASIIVAMIAGAIAGAATGFMAGALGAAIGAVLGSAIGASSGLAMEFMEANRRRHEARLDREIGVMWGDLGAGPVLEHPHAVAGGLYSGVSAAGPSGYVVRAPAEGPFPEPS